MRSAAIPLALLVGLGGVPRFADAQGLREDALELIDQVALGTLEGCDAMQATQQLLEVIQEVNAERFMPRVVSNLRELLAEVSGQCEQATMTTTLRLLGQCEGFIQAEQFCEYLAQCEPVSQANNRMAAFWGLASERCVAPDE